MDARQALEYVLTQHAIEAADFRLWTEKDIHTENHLSERLIKSGY
jgi:hypothetical protein